MHILTIFSSSWVDEFKRRSSPTMWFSLQMLFDFGQAIQKKRWHLFLAKTNLSKLNEFSSGYTKIEAIFFETWQDW